MPECTNPVGSFTAAWEIIPDQFDYFTNIANGYIQAANTFSQQLADYNIVPVEVQPLQWNSGAAFVPFEKPTDPSEFQAPNPQFSGSAPSAPNVTPVDTSGLNVVPNFGSAPDPIPILIAPPPIVQLPAAPTNAPDIAQVFVPTQYEVALPEVPTLYALNLPTLPDIQLGELVIVRPEFVYPDALQDMFIANRDTQIKDLYDTLDVALLDSGVRSDSNESPAYIALMDMLLGGNGLPEETQQLLQSRALEELEVTSARALAATNAEWASRGFSLPGSTLLARTQEIRLQNRVERGKLQRELAIQFSQQEYETLRWAVDKAIQLEGALTEVHLRLYDHAKQVADAQWVITKGIYDSAVDLFRLTLEVYKTDIEAFKERLQIELTKLEVYRSELSALQLIGQLNTQVIEIYNAELQGVLVGVDVFKAQVAAAGEQVRIEQLKLEAFKTQIDIYTATLGGERTKFDVYSAQVGAEDTKARVYASQVDAFGRRVEAYKTQVSAEATKVDTYTRVEESNVRRYAEEVTAWRGGLEADTNNLRAFVDVYRANLSKYEALLSAEQYRVTGEARNFQIEVEQERARIDTLLRQADQSIEQLKHITSLGLSATETAAKVNAQLAASAMSAISVGASMSSSNSVSASDSRSCSTNYSGII